MISVIVPTYNESGTLETLVQHIADALTRDYEIVVVDDDSPDRTWALAEELAHRYPLTVVRRLNERGLSSAVVEGFAKARGEVLAVIDADLSHPPDLLPRLLSELDSGVQIVVASRLISGGSVDNWPWYRRLLSWAGRILARPLTSVHDIMSGYFVIRREVITDAPLIPRGYKILLEILVKGSYTKVSEVPYRFTCREIGSSKMTLETHISFGIQLLHLYWYRMRTAITK